MRIESSVELKKIHAKEIIDHLRDKKNCTKKLIAEELNLSFATVSNICNEMRENGYLSETALCEEKVVGRTPKGITLNYENLRCLCFDLTRFGMIRAAVIDYGASVVYDELFSYEENSSVFQVVEKCRQIYREYILKIFEEGQIVGVGVAVPGIFEKQSHKIVASEIELFNQQPLKAMLMKALHKEVYIDNESNLCAMSEYERAGRCKEQENVIYIFADEGLGIGVIVNGKLVRGSSGYAPEICHMPIGNPKIRCHLCGNFGCVESDLRIMGYIEKYNLVQQTDGNKIRTLEEFLNKIESGEDDALEVMEENAEIMGKLLSVLTNMFNPDCIYIGGKTVEIIERTLDKSLEQVRSRMLTAGNVLPEICLDKDSSATVLKGAAEMMFTQWMPV